MSMRKISLEIGGMHCAACSSALERRLNKQEGIKASVNLALEEAVIEYDEKKVDYELIEKIVAKAGFEVVKENKKPPFEERSAGFRLATAIVLCTVLLYVAMGPMIGLPDPFSTQPLAGAIAQAVLSSLIMLSGYPFFKRGFYKLFTLSPNMDSLVALGTSASFLFSLYNMFKGNIHHSLYFEGAGTIVTLVMLGKALESSSKKKSAKAIEELVALQPDHAVRINEDGTLEDINLKQIMLGDTLLIRPGDKIPTDGTIIEGHAAIDESMLTGESVPSEKAEGDKVFGSTINSSTTFKMRADEVGKDTAIQKIIQMVKEAQGTKAPIARIADKVSLYFVPVVMLLSLITFLSWYIVGNGLQEALVHAVAVLVIACPCALGLATPIAIMVSSGKAARLGVLFRNAEALETLGQSDVFVFDKTGTLTDGKLFVTENTLSREDFRLLEELESLSDHPIARAIVGDDKITTERISDFHLIPGRGCEALFEGRRILAGNERLMNENGIALTAIPSNRAKSFVYLALEENLLGYVALEDTIRSDAKETIERLHKAGKKAIMITGDNEEVAHLVAERIGIDEVYASVLPEGKKDLVKEIRKKHGRVCYIGDGVNDSPALAEADTALSVSSASDVALSSSSVVLVTNKLEDILTGYELSRFTMRNIKENLFWAFFYNSIGIPVAAGILTLFGGPSLSPMLASLAMSLSSLTVVLNALRINSFKKK